MEKLAQIFLWCNEHHFFWIFITIGAILILIDYFFATDFPCQIAYMLFGAAAALHLPLSPVMSLVGGAVIWIIFILLHIVLFRRFLENAPEKE